MGTTSARTAALILDNSQKVLGIELMTAAQAIWLRNEIGENTIEQLSPVTKAAYEFIREKSNPVDQDIIMHDELVKFDEMIKDGNFLKHVENVVNLR